MDEIKKKRFIVKEHFDLDIGKMRKDIFIDDELFSYEVDQESIAAAKKMGPQFFLAAQREVQEHFLDSLSSELGRKITQEDVWEAVRTGWI